MLFFNSTAPLGWTKQTTHNDKAIRLTTGTPGTGGSVGFTTAFANGNTGGTSLTTANLPSTTVTMNSSTPTTVAHSHTVTGGQFAVTAAGAVIGGLANVSRATPQNNTDNTTVTVNAFTPTAQAFGSGTSHNHSLTLAVNYVDALICNKD
jgi:hypothetical protein